MDRLQIAKHVSAERWFAAALIALCLGVFFGNKLIGVGHGLAGIGILAFLVDRKRLPFDWKILPRSAWCLLAFVFVAVVSVLANLDEVAGFLKHVKKLRYEVLILLFLAIPPAGILLNRSRGFRDFCFAVWLAGLFLTTLLGLCVFFLGDRISVLEGIGFEGRVSGIYGQVMTFAHALLFCAVALAGLVVKPDLLRRATRIPPWVFWIAVAIAGVCLYLTYTRGAVFSAAIALSVLAFLRSRWLLLVLALLALSVGTFAYHDQYGGGNTPRYFNAEDPVRINQWTAAGLTFLKNPVFGVGFQNFERKSVELKEQYGLPPVKKVGRRKERRMVHFKGHAHNNYLEAFASTGIFGGLAYLGFCLFWLSEVWRSPRFSVLLVPLVVAFLVSGCFENTFFDSEVRNVILLIYFFSHIILRWEKKFEAGGAIQQPSSA